MATYELTGPDGKTYELTAPDEQSALAAFAQFNSNSQSKPAPVPGDGSVMSGVDNVARQFVKGIPVIGGAADKFAATMDAVTHPVLGRGAEGENFSARYAKNLENEQGRDAAFEAEHPYVSTGANVAGAVAGTIPLAATSVGARGLGMVGSLPARMAQGAAGGGALGAADSATRGQDISTGGMMGAGFGAAFPLAGRAAGAIYDAATRTGAPQAVAGFARGARDKVARALMDDAADPAALQRLGPDAMLLDAGQNLRMQGEALATQPGGANRIVSDAVTQRHQMAPARIRDEVDNTLGPYQNMRETRQAAINARRDAARPAYREAFENAEPVNITPAIEAIDDIVRPGVSRVAEGGPAPDSIQTVLGRVRNVLAGNGAQRIDARDLHTVKLDLDDMVDSAFRSGKGNQGAVLADVRNRVVQALDDATGGAEGHYATARRQYRSDSAVINALDDGRQLFSKATRPDDVVAAVREMSEAERHSFQIGARDAVDEVMGNVANDALAARRMFSKDWNEQKLSAVVGREQAQRLIGAIERENTFADTYGNIQRGSHTRGRQAAGAEFPNKIEEPNTPQVAGRTLTGTVEQAGRGLIDMLRSSGRQAGLEREGSDAARILTAQGPTRDRIVDALMQLQQQSAGQQAGRSSAEQIAALLANAGSQPGQERLRVTVNPARR